MKYSQVPAQVPAAFEWNPLREKDYYYTRIVRDLTRKIRTGAYAAGTYLPYEAQLAKQYGVSAYTVRKALACWSREATQKRRTAKVRWFWRLIRLIQSSLCWTLSRNGMPLHTFIRCSSWCCCPIPLPSTLLRNFVRMIWNNWLPASRKRGSPSPAYFR